MPTPPAQLDDTLPRLLLSIADDKLFLGHANSEWTGLGPILEEDIAFSSLAQDEIGHAQVLYEYVAELRGTTADELAFGRAAEDYRCASIVAVPDEFDWATAIARRFYCDHFDALRLARLARSNVERIAAMARRLGAEEQIHVEHADTWITRLGKGTPDSRSRVQKALDHLAPLAAMLAEPVDGQETLEEAGIYPPGDRDMVEAWTAGLHAVTEAASLTLSLPERDPSRRGGRRGVHPDAFRSILDEMTEVYRIEPGAAW